MRSSVVSEVSVDFERGSRTYPLPVPITVLAIEPRKTLSSDYIASAGLSYVDRNASDRINRYKELQALLFCLLLLILLLFTLLLFFLLLFFVLVLRLLFAILPSTFFHLRPSNARLVVYKRM